jgi:hypothetical protein
MHWFTGDHDELDVDDFMLRSFRDHARYLRAAQTALRGEKRERWRAETASNPAEREEALSNQATYAERAAEAKYRLRSARAFIREDGGTPPAAYERALQGKETAMAPRAERRAGGSHPRGASALVPADRRWPADRARRCRGRAIAPLPGQVVRPLAGQGVS